MQSKIILITVLFILIKQLAAYYKIAPYLQNLQPLKYIKVLLATDTFNHKLLCVNWDQNDAATITSESHDIRNEVVKCGPIFRARFTLTCEPVIISECQLPILFLYLGEDGPVVFRYQLALLYSMNRSNQNFTALLVSGKQAIYFSNLLCKSYFWAQKCVTFSLLTSTYLISN